MPKKKRGRKRTPVIPEPNQQQRVEPYCQHFANCGGCTLQHFSYEAQLEIKQASVDHVFTLDYLLDQLGQYDLPAAAESIPPAEPILAAEQTRGYRNKLEYTFSRRRWLTREEIEHSGEFEHRDGAGFHVRGFFDRVLDIEQCHHQPEPSNRLRLFIRDTARSMGIHFYDIAANEGELRTLMVRTAETGQVMALVMFGPIEDDKRQRLLTAVRDEFPDLSSLYYVVNSTKNSSPIGHEMILHSGGDTIIEQCGHLRLSIHPASFFQTNTRQAVRLYSLVREWAALDGSQTVYDLYSGIGSIGLFLAAEAKRIIGIEVVEDAVAGARENAELNDIHNAVFYVGEAEKICTPGFFAENGRPDVVILDPPRPGLHKKLIASLLEIRSPRILYVSCNAKTQADDLLQLLQSYRVIRRKAVDMFPQTMHVENVVELELIP